LPPKKTSGKDGQTNGGALALSAAAAEPAGGDGTVGSGTNRWLAFIKIDGFEHELGVYGDERAAAQAHDRMARELWGRFLNFAPKDDGSSDGEDAGNTEASGSSEDGSDGGGNAAEPPVKNEQMHRLLMSDEDEEAAVSDYRNTKRKGRKSRGV